MVKKIMNPAERKTMPACYEFGDFRLDTRDQLLFKGGEEIHLTPKALDILLIMLKHHGHVVEKDDLLREVWADTIVEENNLTRTISALRKALDEDSDHCFIETIPKRGYRFTAGVLEIEELPDNATYHSQKITDSELNAGESEGDPGPFLSHDKMADHNKEGTKHRVLPRLKTIKNLLILILAASLMVLLYRNYWPGKQTINTDSFPRLSLDRLSAPESPIEAAISPDGKYIAYTSKDESGLESLFLKHVDSEKILRLVAGGQFKGLILSSDRIYYTLRGPDQNGTFYRMSTNGDEGPKKVLSPGLSSPASLSPDGLSAAFVRSDEKAGVSSLVIADINGGHEQIIFERRLPEFISLNSSPAWSLDGKSLACIIGTDHREYELKATIVDVATKANSAIYNLPWLSVRQVNWLGRSGLIFLADVNAGGWHNQFWFMSTPDGKLTRITNDLADYSGLSLTADQDSLITVQSNNLSNIWVVPYLSNGLSRKITQYNDSREGFHGIDWTPDGQIVFSSIDKGHEHIWIMNSDGTQRTQLSNDAQAESNHQFPRVSPDGRYLVYVSERFGKTRIWRMDIVGNHPRTLTEGPHDMDPQISFDGRWVIFSSLKSGNRKLWKVPITGGEASQVTDHPADAPVFSPTNSLIACAWLESELNDTHRLAVIDLEGAHAPKVLDIPFPTHPPIVQWMPDGLSLTYNQIRNGISNIWRVSLTGGEPAQITDLSFENIAFFAWSRDGKRMAVVRAFEIKNLVTISGLN